MSAEKAVNSVESGVCEGSGESDREHLEVASVLYLFFAPQTHRFFFFPKGGRIYSLHL